MKNGFHLLFPLSLILGPKKARATSTTSAACTLAVICAGGSAAGTSGVAGSFTILPASCSAGVIASVLARFATTKNA